MKSIRLFAAALCLALGAATAQAAPKAQIALTPVQIQTLGIRFAPLLRNHNNLSNAYPAQVLLPLDAERILSAPAAGMIDQIWVQENQTVRPGQPLLRLVSPELGPLQMQLMQASAQQRLAQQQQQREKQLFAEGIIPQRRVQEAQARLSEANAAVQQAKTGLRLMGVSAVELTRIAQGRLQDRITLSAPAAGRVMQIGVKPGQRVATADALLHIARTDKFWLDIQVPLQEARQWRPGMHVIVLGHDLRARILSTGMAVADASQTIKVRALVEEGQTRLRPGELVKAALDQLPSHAAWDLPISAVLRHEGAAYVFVRNARGVEARSVQILSSASQRVRVTGPLKAGDQVVVGGTIALKAAWLGMGGGE